MPETTTRLYAVQSTYVDSQDATGIFYQSNTVKATAEALVIENIQNYQFAFLSFEQPPEVMRRRITNIVFHLYNRGIFEHPTDSSTRSDIYPNAAAFNEKTTDYYNYPRKVTESSATFLSARDYAWKTAALEGKNDDDNRKELGNAKVLLNGIQIEARFYTHSPPSNVNRHGSETYGARSSYRPYIEVTAVPAAINVTNLAPSAGAFINKKVPARFSWSIFYNKDIVPGILGQKSALFRWRPKGSANHTQVSINGSATEYIMPANTLSSSEIEWQVIAVSEDDVSSPASPWITLTTIDSIAAAAPISPVNTYIETDQPNTFSWSHVIDTGSASTKSELQYSVDKTLWNALTTVTGSGLTAAIPSGTLPIDRVWWRVRTYNTDNVAGNWSDPAAIVVRGRPRPPSISSISNESRPVIRWQSASQAAYQLQIVDASGVTLVDTKESYGAGKVYCPNDYLPTGAYSVRLRIKASNGLWSEWTQSGFTISASLSIAPQILCTPVDGAVRVEVSNASSFDKLYLLRNGKPIAKIGAEYMDYTAEQSQYYTVRGVNAADNFADSLPELVRSEIALGGRLAAVSDLSNMIVLHLRRNEPVAQETDVERLGTAVYYAGREYPVYHYSEHAAQNTSTEFAVKDREKYHALLNLLNRRETILYRDLYGEKFYCAIPSVSDTRDHLGVSFTLSMQRVDYKETIPYDKKVVT